MSSVYAPASIGYTMLMRPQKTETAVQSCLIPAPVLRMRTVMATSRGWCNAVMTYLVYSSQLTAAHSLFSLPLSSLTLQNSGTNRDHLRLNQLSQMENTTSLLTLVVTTSCPWYMHRINRLHECFFS